MNLLKEFDVRDKKVLVRCDFNVPLDKEGNVLDDFRIKKTIPTIQYLIENKAKVILMSHLDSPGGKIVEKLRMNKIYGKIKEYLEVPIYKTQDCLSKEAEVLVKKMKPGEIILLENLRFHSGEEKNDTEFAKELAKLGEIYINDAFSVSHRYHASIVGIPKILSSGIGLLMEKEISILSKIIENPERPLVVLLGGAKIETKVKLIDKISNIAEFVLTGGLLNKEIKEKNIILVNHQKIISAKEGLDMEKEDVKKFKEKIYLAKTIFWNGPFGKIEDKKYVSSTTEIAKAVSESPAFSVIGGGETIEFVGKIGLIDKFSHVSTGGGAMMAFLSGEKLPGLEALN
ncbi:phosphoglycerate kinase [Patescibacteria group bacterium]